MKTAADQKKDATAGKGERTSQQKFIFSMSVMITFPSISPVASNVPFALNLTQVTESECLIRKTGPLS